MQNRSGAPTDPGQSPLSLLVSAAEGRNQSEASSRPGETNGIAGASLADQLRLRAAQEGGPSLEEQLLLQQQAQQQQQQASNFGNNAALLGLRDPNLLQQLAGAGQNPQLAALLGLGGGGAGDLRQALAAQQLRQAAASNQLSHADILALSRSGALGGGGGSLFGGALGGMGALGAAAAAQAGLGSGTGGLASELESLQRLEEIERRQRLMAAGADPLMGNTAAAVQAAREQQQQLASQVQQQHQAQLQAQQAAQMQSQGLAPPGVRGPVIRDERIPGGHIPRPNLDSSINSKKDGSKAAGTGTPTQASNLTSDEAQAAAAMVAASTGGCKVVDDKEELEKTPGSVIVPCRARGMPMDHNFKTAYFVIPENVKHGEELICSYFACRNAGIKFRYCSHCKVPVAKRNFRKRHKHGGNDVAQLPGDEDSGAEDEVPSKRAGIPSQITAKAGVEADALSSNSAQSNDKEEIQQGLVRSSMRNLEQQQAAKAASSPPSAPAAAISRPPEGDNPKINADRRNRWASLLGRRPATKDGDSMSSWLMEVLAVSDLDTPLKPSEDMNGKPKADLSAVAKVASAMAAQKKEDDQKEPAAPSASAAGVVKKKRPADFMPNEDMASTATSESATPQKGSYAAWKERKKQKNKRNTKPKTSEDES